MDTPPPFTVDLPTADDAAALGRVHVDAWRDAYGALLPERFYDDGALARREAQWARSLAAWSPAQVGERMRIVRGPGGRAEGFAVIGPPREDDPPTPTELQSLYLRRDLYGTGAAQALVRSLLGERPAHLWVADPNPRAQAFYAKLGFRPDGTALTDPALDGLREIRMVRGPVRHAAPGPA